MTITGEVKTGQRRGKRIGFPTINVSVPRGLKKDQWGIYFSLVNIDGKVYPGVTHLGPVKTFSLRNKTCETYLLTLRDDLYGTRVQKKLIFKFRDIEKYPTVAALKRQIKKDVTAAKKFFGL
ncbi:MAG: hypothetical protein HUU49_02620 [Candidatus Buchananbacteria bacterium]|nr:hypothetical protein [Candidatus Buchananbacteria bacterium]